MKEESAAGVATAKEAAEKVVDEAGEASHAALSAESIRCALGYYVKRSMSNALTTRAFNSC